VGGVLALCLAGVVTLVAIGIHRANQLMGTAHVVAEVTGSGPTQISFLINRSVTETGTRQVPYFITKDLARYSTVVRLTVQSTIPGGTATCRILIDGSVMITRTETGFNSQALCETSV
jgi:hypothetical protein